MRGIESRRMLPPRAWLLSLLAQIPMVLWFWPPKPAGGAVVLGIGMLVAGCVLNVWAEGVFRASGVGVCPFTPVSSLVSKGLFRWSRNPMYLGLVMISAGVAVATGQPWNLCAPAVLALWLHFRYVLPEEEFLRERLGLEYVMYASCTPRWFGLPGNEDCAGAILQSQNGARSLCPRLTEVETEQPG